MVGPVTRARLLQDCQQTVAPAPFSLIKVGSPNGGESWQSGNVHTIEWSSFKPFSYVDIDILSWLPPCYQCSTAPSAPTSFSVPLARKVPNSGSFPWTVGQFLSGSLPPTGTFVIRVSNSENLSIYDQSNAVFNIVGNLPPVISGGSGPVGLNIGQDGTWTVEAYDPENGPLSYYVIWGDESSDVKAVAQVSQEQTVTFIHTYMRQGVFSPTFIVADAAGFYVSTVTPSIHIKEGGVY